MPVVSSTFPTVVDSILPPPSRPEYREAFISHLINQRTINRLIEGLSAAQQSIGINIFSPTRYGAIGDGIADDTVAIQAAIDAAEVSGGTVFFPAGTYLVTGLVVSADDVTLRGAGPPSIITTATDDTAIALSGVSGVMVADLAIVGDDDALKTAQNGVKLTGCTDCFIRNIRVNDIGYDGLQLISGNARNVVSGCVITNPNDDGINVGGSGTPTGTVDTAVIGNVVSGATSDGIHVSIGSERTTVSGNVIDSCTGDGVGLHNGDGVSVTGNTIYNCGRGVDVNATSTDVSVTGNMIEACDRGIMVTLGGTRWAITGNTIKNATTYGIALSGTGSIRTDATVTGNVIYDGCASAAILASGCSYVTIADNHISTVDAVGILVPAVAAQYVNILNNQIECTAGTLGISCTANANLTHCRIEGNTILPGSRGIEYRGGAYFTIKGNTVVAATDFGVVVSLGSAVSTWARVQDNLVQGGCTTAGIFAANADDMMVLHNIVQGITATVAINVSSGSRVFVGPQTLESGDTISGTANEGLSVTIAPAGSTPGTVTNYMTVYSELGAVIGVVPIYDAVT